ncbi:pyrroline-5-carboxylate reductase [Enterovirga rhinocerotis]|uniref:Pyrroline-5-carboxylate reductase n=1 Tax=Enterovirga rhinocerotis TaxID=1339210 RepID=A0A4R7BNN5_9HYPH|nr:pyrroline-5-carboxylate reductase [Enterovirga rhinocerotis]TDR87150.1 pyrroline-5-carboxylate reductase [Enterovirga rhinocerotis]
MTAPTSSGAGPLPASLVLAGAGKMGGAMLDGWLAAGLADGAATVLDPNPSEPIRRLAETGRIRIAGADASSPPDVLVLGIKPQSLEEAASLLGAHAGPDTLVISILAGKTVADLRRALPAVSAVVRAMPNLPASIGRGATGAYASPETSAAQRDMAARLLACNGVVEWVGDEGLIDAVTALSGSGPAYVFHLVEAMAAAGEAAGLEAGLAQRLARATVAGAGALLDASELPAAQLRENVTSKGGTTAAALEVLMAQDGLPALMTRAVAAAKRRAGELSG